MSTPGFDRLSIRLLCGFVGAVACSGASPSPPPSAQKVPAKSCAELASGPRYVCVESAGGLAVRHPSPEAVVAERSVASDGSFFALGTFRGDSVVFGAGEPQQTVLHAWDDGMTDIFVAKYDASGVLVWARRAGGRRMDEPGGIVATRDGGAIVVGSYYDEMRFGPIDHSEATLPSENSASFAARYDARGHVTWARRIGGDYVRASKLAVTSAEAAIVVGDFEGTLRFDGAATLHSRGQRSEAESSREVPIGTHKDGFLAQFDRKGRLAWAKAIGGPGEDVASGVAVDGNEVIVVGSFSVQASFGALSLDAVRREDGFIARYLGDGTLRWARSFGGLGADSAHTIAIDGARKTWVTVTLGAVDPAAEAAAIMQSPGRPELFLVSYDTEGTRCSLEPLVCSGTPLEAP